MSAPRKIIHIDMDAFYVSVEQRENPALRARPVVVGGSPQSRAVVCSASYEARKFGVRSAMSCAQAARLCPQAVFVPPRFSLYSGASEQIHRIFRDYTELVEPLSLDEAYLDVSVNKKNEPWARTIAVQIKERIRRELGLSASAGVAPNKFIAKIASDLKKPDGLVVVPPEKVLEFVAGLRVEKFWGVGPKTAERLRQAGLETALDIRARSREQMTELLGSFGEFLWELSWGRDERGVDPEWDPKSRGSERTFERDLTDTVKLEEWIETLAQEVASELKELKRPGKTISVKIKYSDFQTITRSQTLHRGTAEDKTIAEIARDLLYRDTEVGSRPVRLIGVSVSGLVDPGQAEQLWLDEPGGGVF